MLKHTNNDNKQKETPLFREACSHLKRISVICHLPFCIQQQDLQRNVLLIGFCVFFCSLTQDLVQNPCKKKLFIIFASKKHATHCFSSHSTVSHSTVKHSCAIIVFKKVSHLPRHCLLFEERATCCSLCHSLQFFFLFN